MNFRRNSPDIFLQVSLSENIGLLDQTEHKSEDFSYRHQTYSTLQFDDSAVSVTCVAT